MQFLRDRFFSLFQIDPKAWDGETRRDKVNSDNFTRKVNALHDVYGRQVDFSCENVAKALQSLVDQGVEISGIGKDILAKSSSETRIAVSVGLHEDDSERIVSHFYSRVNTLAKQYGAKRIVWNISPADVTPEERKYTDLPIKVFTSIFLFDEN